MSRGIPIDGCRCSRSLFELMGIGVSAGFSTAFLVRQSALQEPLTPQQIVEDMIAPAFLILFLLIRHLSSYPKVKKGAFKVASFMMLLAGVIFGGCLSLVGTKYDTNSDFAGTVLPILSLCSAFPLMEGAGLEVEVVRANMGEQSSLINA